MDGYVYFRAGSLKELDCLLSHYARHLAFVMQWQPDGDSFLEFGQWSSPRQYLDQGRCFGPTLELRWQRLESPSDGATHDLWVLSEAPQLNLKAWESPPPYEALDQHGEQALRIYLWGAWRPSMQGWVETRIPRLLHYPLTSAQEGAFAYVRAIEYRQAGMVRYTRYCALEWEARHDG